MTEDKKKKVRKKRSLLKSFLRRIPFFFLALTCCFALFIAALPKILSSKAGINFFLNEINQDLSEAGFKVSIEEASFSWFGNQSIKNLKLSQNELGQVLFFDSLSIDTVLYKPLLYGFTYGPMRSPLMFLLLDLTSDRGASLEGLNIKFAPFLGKDFSLCQLSAKLFRQADSEILCFDLNGEVTAEEDQGRVKAHFKCTSSKNDLRIVFKDAFEAFLGGGEGKEGIFDVSIDLEGIPLTIFDCLVFAENSEFRGLLLESLGEKFDLKLRLDASKELPYFTTRVNSEYLNGGLAFYAQSNGLTLKEPANFSWMLRPKLIAKLAPILSPRLSIYLDDPGEVRLNLSQFQTKKNHQGALDFYIKSSVNVADLKGSVVSKAKIRSFKVSDLEMEIQSEQSSLNLKTLAKLSIDKKDYDPSLYLSLNRLDETLAVNIGLFLDGEKWNLDIHPLSIAHLDKRLSNLVLAGELSANNIKVPLSLKESKSPYSVIFKDLNFPWTLNLFENTFDFAVNAQAFFLKGSRLQPAGELGLKGECKDFFQKDQRHLDVSRMKADVKGRLSAFTIREVERQEVFASKALEFNLKGDALSNHLSLNLLGNGLWQFADKISKPWELDLSVNLSGFSRGTRKDVIKNILVDLQFTASHFPIGTLLGRCYPKILRKNPKDPFFYETVDIETDIKVDHMNGQVFSFIRGECFSLDLEADLKDGRVLLKRPLESRLFISKALSQSLLADINVLYSHLLFTEQPVRLWVDSKGFEWIPKKGFAGLNIPSVIVDVGKGSVEKGGPIDVLMNLLKVRQYGDHTSLSIWLTPIYFSFHNGQLVFKRFDALLDNFYPIAIWGKVDMISDDLSMVIGLTDLALERALGIKNLKEGYFMQVPVRGSSGNPKVRTEKIVPKIAALIIKDQSSHGGGLFGSLLNMVSRDVNGEKVPEPTTKPLPWAQ